MPINSYKCDKCNHEFDKLQKLSDERLTTCPECKEESLRYTYNPVGAIYNATGFYSTSNGVKKGNWMD